MLRKQPPVNSIEKITTQKKYIIYDKTKIRRFSYHKLDFKIIILPSTSRINSTQSPPTPRNKIPMARQTYFKSRYYLTTSDIMSKQGIDATHITHMVLCHRRSLFSLQLVV
ncbi:hypothetical protein OIU84_020679 [Salix udensis]|uniref:Uncharacterized protein n=1 Tax=Salix udensis TaxID=889485 RepID=A0AAD6PI25_9ROSI|nr:hypothetical protein OIU84_020679 [Salix udensis]